MRQQITIPYAEGFDFGIGTMITAGTAMGTVVEGEVTGVLKGGGGNTSCRITRIRTTEELQKALNLDVEVSYGCRTFGAGVDARFSFARNQKIETSSLFLTAIAEVNLGFRQIDAPCLTAAAREIADNAAAFQTRYGDYFCRGIRLGGRFVGVLKIDTGSEETSQSIAAELGGTYGAFSGDAKFKLDEVKKKYNAAIHYEINYSGEVPGISVRSFDDPLEMLANLDRWMEAFQKRPLEVAAPYFITLTPVEVADGPLPPNEEDIKHVQQLLVTCAKRRSRLWDELALLEKMNTEPNRFDFSNGAQPELIREAIEGIESDIQLIADCASEAIDHPKNALLPGPYSKQKKVEFPRARLPEKLPISKKWEVRVDEDLYLGNWAPAEAGWFVRLTLNKEVDGRVLLTITDKHDNASGGPAAWNAEAGALVSEFYQRAGHRWRVYLRIGNPDTRIRVHIDKWIAQKQQAPEILELQKQ